MDKGRYGATLHGSRDRTKDHRAALLRHIGRTMRDDSNTERRQRDRRCGTEQARKALWP